MSGHDPDLDTLVAELNRGLPSGRAEGQLPAGASGLDPVLTHAAQLGASDLLLLAGKGHEPYQDVQGVKHPYSDRAAVEAVLRGQPVARPWAVVR